MIAKGFSERDLFTIDRDEEYRYVDYEDGVKIIGYSGLREYIEIPEILNGKKVVAIGCAEKGHYQGDTEPNILIPNTVTYIDPKCKRGKMGCWFTELFLKDDNEHFVIEGECLYSKDKKRLYFCIDARKEDYDELVIPDSVEYIGEYAFEKIHYDKISIPDSVKMIGTKAFAARYRQDIVEIPKSVEKLGGYISRDVSLEDENSFYKVENGCIYTKDGKVLVQCVQRNITQVEIPDTVEEIRPYAFDGIRITKLDLGAGVQKIGEGAFSSAEVKTIRIPDQLTELSERAFGYVKCNSIRVRKKNSHFQSDGKCFFSIDENGEKRLLKCFKNKEEEYDIPEGVTSIAPEAFGECTSMKKITLPQSLKCFDEACLPPEYYSESSCAVKHIQIPENVVELKISSEKITYDIVEGNKAYFVEDGIIYHRVGGNLEIIAAKNVSGVLTLKPGVTVIKAYAFSECKKITKVICNQELRKIEQCAFIGSWIEEISFNDGIEYIDGLAFAGSKVGKTILPASLKYINASAFRDCNTVEFEVDENNSHYCANEGALYTKSMTELIFVPKAREFKSFKVPSDVTEIGCAFRDCKNISEIVIPATVKNIWNDALDCKVKDIYFEGDIRSFADCGVDIFGGVKIHADADTGAAQYVEWLRRSYGDVKISLAINGVEDVSALSKDYEVMLNDTGITIIKMIKAKKIMTIPDKIGSYPVTKIADRAFEEGGEKEPIEELVIPESITEIGCYAFKGNQNLRKIILPKGLKKISKCMLNYCPTLEEVIIPEGVEEICEAAFYGCKNIKKIYFPASVTKISDFFMADEGGKNKDLYLSESTVYVVEPGSYSEKFLKAYKPDDICDCEKLVVLYPNQVSAPVSEEVKKTLEYLDYKVQDDGTVSVCMESFWKENHPDVRIPNTFQGMPVTKLTGMDSIHNSMEMLYIPENILSIEGLYYGSFYSGGQNMKKIEVAENNPNYWSDGRALYTKDKSVLIHMFDYQAEEYEVCSDTKEIAKEAFGKFLNLKKLILPDGLEVIRERAFCGCVNLEEIIGVEKVKTIEEEAFSSTPYYGKCSILFSGTVLQKYNKTDVTRYEIPEGTTEIAEGAFRITSEDAEDVLETVVIPASVKSIGAGAFSGRRRLKTVNIPDGVEKIEENTFLGCESMEKITIPSSVKEISLTAFPIAEPLWRGVSEIPSFSAIEVDEKNEVYCSLDGVLYSRDMKTLVLVPNNFNETEFVVPKSVEIIGRCAFQRNRAIKKVKLSSNVRIISEYAFNECVGLEKINLKAISTIGIYAFKNCENLKSVRLSAASIGEGVFSGCRNLKTIYLEGTRVIGKYAFRECGIKKLNLPDGLEEIGAGAFSKCALREVTVPKTVLKVGNESFSGCKEITIYDTIDPNAKPCTEHLDNLNGHPNSNVGFIGIGWSWAMWECAANHRWLDYEIIVRSADTDEIKYKVWMGSDPKQRWYYCTLTSSWGKCASFNFSALDNAFAEMKGVDHKIRVALNRLRYPEMLLDVQKKAYVAYLVRSAKKLVSFCIDNNDMETLLFCEPFGVIKKNNINELLDYAVKKKAEQFSTYLLAYKDKNFGGSSGKKTSSVKVKQP